jgi:putative oxidoreductase
MNGLDASLNAWQPRILSILRIVAGLLFMQHGLSKHFAFPIPYVGGQFPMFGQIWFAGWIEIIGGLLLVLGLFTRWVAFLCSGLMAFAYFLGHQHRAWFPLANAGNLAILYCFVFFYLFFAGGGPWSVDATRDNKA